MNSQDDRHARLAGASHPRRARADDAAVLARLFAAAFATDPVFDWIARSGPKRAPGLERFFFWLLQVRAIPFGEVWMAGDGTVAAAWLPPDVPATAGGVLDQLRLLPMFLRLCGLPRLLRGSAMADAMEKHHPHDRHYYLAFIAVAPRLQGLGLGSAMLEATLKRADGANLPAYLENSNPRNTSLYERHGFIVRKDITPRGAPPLLAMWRHPRAAPVATLPRT
ncbi:MAG: GNAT family N-acetyltransferase [Rhizomicrobium sp.]|jgi:ribosomal protein S18 acetylase RimI-like enzyme